MTWSVIQDEAIPTPAGSNRAVSKNARPFRSALDRRDDLVKMKGPVMSDLQLQMQNEQKQHQDAYQYEHGHNDHGLGQ